MYSLQKKGRFWHAIFFPRDGARFQRSTGCTRKDDARRWAERVVSTLASGGTVTTLQSALDQLADYKVAARLSTSTMEILEQKGNHLLRFFGNDTPVHSITLARCQEYVAHRRESVSDSTIAKELGTLSQALGNLRRHDLYNRDPGALWPPELKKASGRRKRWLPVAEFEAILKHMGPTDTYERSQPFGPDRKGRRKQIIKHGVGLGDDYRDHLRVYCYTGIRASELYRIEARHYNPRTRELFVAGTKTARSARTVPVHDDISGILSGRRRGATGALFPTNDIEYAKERFKKKINRACAIAGVEHTSHNDLRRTFVSWCLHWDIPEHMVVWWMGHGSTRMVREVYGQPSAEHGRKWINRLPSICQQGTGKRTRRQGRAPRKPE